MNTIFKALQFTITINHERIHNELKLKKMRKEKRGNIAGNIILGIFHTLFIVFIIYYTI
jgi:hypothetical protein